MSSSVAGHGLPCRHRWRPYALGASTSRWPQPRRDWSTTGCKWPCAIQPVRTCAVALASVMHRICDGSSRLLATPLSRRGTAEG